MTSVKVGRANEAFEASEEDDDVDSRYGHGKAQKTTPSPPISPNDEPNGCKFFGLISLPTIFSKVFLNAAWMLVFLSWASTIQGMVINGFVNVVLSSLERRFDLLSTETGVIAGSYDIGSMLSIIPISYFGGRIGTSKPKYISFGLIVMGLGSLMFTFPHFVTDDYLMKMEENNVSVSLNSEGGQDQLCNSLVETSTTTATERENALALARSLANNKYFFIFGQILHGIGAAPLISLGTALLDESVSRVAAPLYIGIFQTFFVVGPAIGYMLGGYFLEIYTDFDQGGNIQNLNSSSPLWVGAWWLGFMVSFVTSLICAVFVGCFPAIIPRKIKTEELAHKTSTIGMAPSIGKTSDTPNIEKRTRKSTISYGKLKDLPNTIWTLLTNPTYMMINMGGGADGFIISGLSAFLPKFLQSQYGFSAGISGAIVGAIVIPAGGLGTFFGGYISKRFKLNRSQVIKLYIYCQAITVPCAIGVLFYCPSPNFANVNGIVNTNCDSIDNCTYTWNPQPQKTVFQPQDLQSLSCNKDCNCDASNFAPICNQQENVMYFSACYAGCLNKLSVENKTEYHDCQCMPSQNKMATLGSCDRQCKFLPGFLVTIFISIWFTFMAAMPNVVATLRSVEPIHRSLALGIESIILRLIGTIPGPIFFGYIIDQSCLLKDGNCLFYDNYTMAISMALTTVVMKAIGKSNF